VENWKCQWDRRYIESCEFVFGVRRKGDITKQEIRYSRKASSSHLRIEFFNLGWLRERELHKLTLNLNFSCQSKRNWILVFFRDEKIQIEIGKKLCNSSLWEKDAMVMQKISGEVEMV
jgi:hypothetical protein